MTREERSIRMSHIHSTSTTPELRLRHSIWNHGFRYLVNDKRLPGSPDIVLPKYRTAIFVHGCFWHGHNNCKTNHIPESNSDFWSTKIARNHEHDQEVWRQLEAKGWFVIIVWECQLKKAVLDETVARVEEEILSNGEMLSKTREDRRKAREAYRQEMSARKERDAAMKAELNL